MSLGKLFEWARPHKKHVYYLNEGSLDERHILGAKGANLCEMHRLGMPVPSAFILTADSCLDFFKSGAGYKGHALSEEVVADYKKAVHELEKQTGKMFAPTFAGTSPQARAQHENKTALLLSVRAGAAVSMPGMMDSVLNLGMNDEIVEFMARCSNNPRWAYDTYRRFLQMYGNVVLNTDKKAYENIMENARKKRNVPHDSLLPMADLKEIVQQFKLLANVPNDPWEQLYAAIQAVFRSWNSPRAVKYRDIHNIPSDLGTAVVVQSMVYGNMNIQSGSGVAFTRNPVTGAKELYGEYLPNAEGEDVSAGIRTPIKLSELRKEQPAIFDSLMHIEHILEKHFRDMQDIEFTVENRMLFILETRTAKRTAQASVCAAVMMVKEKLITEREAMLRIDAQQMDFFLHPMIDTERANPNDPMVRECVLCRGAPASAGAAVGRLVFTPADAVRCQKENQPCILVRMDTSVDDLEGLKAAEGVFTLRGGLTSHAAVVMRGMGKSAVTGAQDIVVDWAGETLTSRTKEGVTVHKGDMITVDGSSGTIYLGEMPTRFSGPDENFSTIMQWANKYKRMDVFATAGTREQIETAQRMGAEGIGLFRTEEMFKRDDCVDCFRKVIMAENPFDRAQWLLQMLPMQQQDFLEIFRLMGDTQVTIRLLDPPLHEFLPNAASPNFEQEIQELSARLEMSSEACMQRLQNLQESNPMLGFRGCRLGIVYPEIIEMQTRAIIGAAIQARQENIAVRPHILIPMVFTDHEVDIITPIIASATAATCTQSGTRFDQQSLECSVGAMIETPRACIRADRIAEASSMDFVTIGSNDLTQLIFGMGHDDADNFMPAYVDLHLVARDPFRSLDIHGVGGMIQMAVRRCRRANKHIKISVCGEHAGDPMSINFFDRIGADNVTCSPYRIPIAKVAAAQAHIEETAMKKHMEIERQRQMLLAPFPMGPHIYV